MSFKTIATVLTDPNRAAEHLDKTVAVAQAFEGLVEAVCVGIDHSRPDLAFPEAMPAFDSGAAGVAAEDARALEDLVNTRLKGQPIRWESESYVVTSAALAGTVAQAPQFVDLPALPRPYGPATPPIDETIAEAAMFNGPAPVLFADALDMGQMLSGPMLVGWNETAEAMAAIRAALPLLQNASLVHIVMVAPRPRGVGRSDPGGALARFLTRHGCKVEVAVLAQTLPRASDELLRHAREIRAELMVLGAYGHSRLREAVFGGATRNLLQTSEIPLLMAR